MSNEMQTEERTRSGSPSTGQAEPGPLTQTQRRVGRTLFVFAMLALVIGCMVAAILFQTWLLFFLGVLVLVPYALLLMAPVWLARTSRVAANSKDT